MKENTKPLMDYKDNGDSDKYISNTSRILLGMNNFFGYFFAITLIFFFIVVIKKSYRYNTLVKETKEY